MVKRTTLICARDVGHWNQDLHGLQQDLNVISANHRWHRYSHWLIMSYLLQISEFNERVCPNPLEIFTHGLPQRGNAGLLCSNLYMDQLPSCTNNKFDVARNRNRNTRKRGTWPWACQRDVEQRGEISSDLGSPCDHFDVRAKHYRWAQRCQSWHTDIHAQMSCKPIEHIFGDLCRAHVQQNHVGTFRHAQVWAEGNEEHDHEPVSGMWSKGERSAQTLGLLGVILGVNRKYPGFLLSHLSGLASRLGG